MSNSLCSTFRTIRDLLRFAVTRFNRAHLAFGHGLTNAYDEASYLILHTLHLPLDMLDVFLDARLTEKETTMVFDVIEKRVTERIPAAYITHEAWMHGIRFYVDERVIVPRSFIGELLQNRLQPYVENPKFVGAVLELCTGCGCLAILTAYAFPNVHIDAVDLSIPALAVATRNVREHALDKRIMLFEGDLFTPLPKRRYDIIITNPPYVNVKSMHTLPAEYRHEPEIALAGGNDGMDIVRRIIAEARNWLTKKGMLIVEIGNERSNVEAVFNNLNLVWLPTSTSNDNVFLIQAVDLPL